MSIDVEEYYKKYGPMVLRRCRFLLGNEEGALDAMQEVFARLLVYKDRLHDQYPSSMLYRMATNVCLNIIRADKKVVQSKDDEWLSLIASYDDMEERTLLRDFLDRIFAKEKPSTREIALMHYVDGMTLEETAAEAGLSVSGVRKRLRLLRERVKEMKEFDDE